MDCDYPKIQFLLMKEEPLFYRKGFTLSISNCKTNRYYPFIHSYGTYNRYLQ